jgi:predicted nucleic acid-binding Zn ribbon protein
LASNANRKKSRHGPEGLGDILGREMARRKRRAWDVDEKILRKWAEVAGPAIAARTSVLSFRRKILRVRVDSSALLAELDGVYRKHLIISLAEGGDPVYVRNVSFELSGAARGR